MRERWAKRLALATSVMVLVLAAAFALILNRPGAQPAADTVPTPVVDADGSARAAQEQIARGREVFARQYCSDCHSVAGRGSPRSPLDGVGSRRDREELRAWVVADESVRAELSPRAIAAKQDYAHLPDPQMDALLAYLGSLRE